MINFKVLAALFCCLFLVVNVNAQSLKALMIDDFEGEIIEGPAGTVDSGAGNGSFVKVSASGEIKNSGNQALKVEYDAIAGGYMWIARGNDLDVKGAACWLEKPQDINWQDYNAISFYVYGDDSKGYIAFDIKDKGSEIWRFMVENNFSGWKQIVCPFNQFFSRSDWQPGNADKNDVLDFPVKSFQFEMLPTAKGTVYFDSIELLRTE